MSTIVSKMTGVLGKKSYGYVRVDILVIPVNKDVRIRSTVVDVNSGVDVNQIYAVILKDAI